MIDHTKQDAELIGLALKHKSSILHRPELYYTFVPNTGICGLFSTGNVCIGELIDIWDHVPGAHVRCPKCLHPAPLIRFIHGVNLRKTCFICPECGEEYSYNGSLYDSKELFIPLRDMRKTYVDGTPQGLDWYTTFRDEMTRIELLGEPIFDTDRLQQPVFPQTLCITLYNYTNNLK